MVTVGCGSGTVFCSLGFRHLVVVILDFCFFIFYKKLKLSKERENIRELEGEEEYDESIFTFKNSFK